MKSSVKHTRGAGRRGCVRGDTLFHGCSDGSVTAAHETISLGAFDALFVTPHQDLELDAELVAPLVSCRA